MIVLIYSILPVTGFPNVTVPENAVGTLNGDIILMCNVDANPSVTSVEWSTVNGTVVTSIDVSADHYSGSTRETPSLTIQSLRKADAGVYHCSATSDLGTGESNPDLMLVVHCKFT